MEKNLASSSPLAEPACIVDDHFGIYVPQRWAELYGAAATDSANVRADDVSILLTGPSHELYWEAWDQVLNGYCHELDGVKHYLWQDGALFECPETYDWPQI